MILKGKQDTHYHTMTAPIARSAELHAAQASALTLSHEKRVSRGLAQLRAPREAIARRDLKANQHDALVGVLWGWRALTGGESLPPGFAGRRRCVEGSQWLRTWDLGELVGTWANANLYVLMYVF